MFMFPITALRISFLTFCMVLLALNLSAQLVTTASINGTVTDTTGAVVPEADVTLTDQATKAVIRTKTNADGGFVSPGLAIGSYTVTVSKGGFQTFSETGVALHPATVTT